jgi:hypothetical protein
MGADERKSRRGMLTLWAAAGLFIASAFLPGALAVASGIIGGIALVTGLAATIFAPSPGDGGAMQAPRPQEAARGPQPEPQQSIRLHVDTPASVRRWLERVEAEAEAAKRSR